MTGDNGLFKRAKEARTNTLDAQNKENETLEGYEDSIDEVLGGETATTVAEARGGKKYNNTTPITDDSGDTLYIPGGFMIAEDSATEIDDGVVITDRTSEFVWVPVDKDTLEVAGNKVMAKSIRWNR